MALNDVTVVLGLALDIGSPGLIFTIWLISKLGGWLTWIPSINVILSVIISQRIVFVVPFWPKISLPGVTLYCI